MGLRNNLTFLITGTLLLSLASCGNDKKTSSRQEANPVCSEIDCLSSVNWKIQLQGRAFPDKARLDINGTTVLNECVSKQRYSIDRYTEPQSVYLDNFYVPKRGELKISVVDLGQCDSERSFIVKFGSSNEIHINL
jgi:hypothetical protein